MNAGEKSDGIVQPANLANNDHADGPAELREGRVPAKRNASQKALCQTQRRNKHGKDGLTRVREAARKDSTLVFTALLHHINPERLRASFYALKRDAALGIDKISWHEYERNVKANIADLHGRVHRGAYRAQPSLRIWIPKPDGRQRPLGIAAMEDKIVQHATVAVLQSIYEEDFLGFSYGFRPGRSQHDALDALSVAVTSKRVNWVLDADIKGFFDRIDHEWLLHFLEQRIGDPRVLRLIRKWLRAGVSEEGKWSETTVGTPQGAVISPLLANVFLHYVFDLWLHQWRQNRCRGDVIVVRYADDFVIGFEHRSEALACQQALRTRLSSYGLELHPGKTRLIEFGRFAAERRQRRGQKRPETFDFLGFTHICATTRRHGWYTIHRHSAGKRVRATLLSIRQALKRRKHRPLGETGRWLRRVVRGWLNYHAVPSNSYQLCRFIDEVTRMWLTVLRRRSQRGRRRWTWKRMHRVGRLYLPRPRILHPYPKDRFRARLKARAV